MMTTLSQRPELAGEPARTPDRTPDRGADHGADHGSGRQWLGRGLIAAGIGMIPWLVVLAISLPASAHAEHWSMAWVGLDGAEGLALLATGLLLIRRDDRCSLTAAVAATLVLIDAWFDVTTATPGVAEITALAMAACIEVPVSLLCAALAVRSFPAAGRDPGRSGKPHLVAPGRPSRTSDQRPVV